ncbi:MAG TPA: HisA/HisF-related TIM barrel protein, partial [Acidiphilium sp.]
GIAAIIHTDIARDGMLAGLNLEATETLARAVAIPVIASGGVAGIADIRRLREAAARTPNLAGTIIGRALYDGSIDPAAALAEAA